MKIYYYLTLTRRIIIKFIGSIDESSKTGVKGRVFDSSLKRNRPFEFTLGAREVIQGWEQGFVEIP